MTKSGKRNVWVCEKCKIKNESWKRCNCGGTMRAMCNHMGCEEPGYKQIYVFGYLATMCQFHYEESTNEEKSNAKRFKYAE